MQRRASDELTEETSFSWWLFNWVKNNKRLIVSIGSGLLFSIAAVVAAPFVIAATSFVMGAVATFIVVACAALIVDMLVAVLTMAAFKLYDYCTSESEDDENQRMVQQITNSLVAVNKKLGSESGIVKREEVKSEKTSAQPVPVMVTMQDGTQVPKEKVDAIHAKLLKLDSCEKRVVLHYLLIICEAKVADRNFYLSMHKFEMTALRAANTEDDKSFPVIKSDNTMDDDSCKIISCILRKEEGEFVDQDMGDYRSILKM